MRSVIGQLVIAILLAAAGAVCWALGKSAEGLAQGSEELVTLQYEAAAGGNDDVNRWIQYAAPVPGIGDSITADVRKRQATADYWLEKYDELGKLRLANTSEREPHLLLLASNAAFRAAQATPQSDRATALQRLQEAEKNYAEVLKTSPSDDAAYNYELVARLHDQLERTPRGVAPKPLTVALGAAVPETIHGRAGGPPKGTEMSQFRIMVPKRSDEREENQEAGKGNKKIRRG